jgi:hypothetical protein
MFFFVSLGLSLMRIKFVLSKLMLSNLSYNLPLTRITESNLMVQIYFSTSLELKKFSYNLD